MLWSPLVSHSAIDWSFFLFALGVAYIEVIADVHSPGPTKVLANKSVSLAMEGKGQSRAAKRRKKSANKKPQSELPLSASPAAAPLPRSDAPARKENKGHSGGNKQKLMDLVHDHSLHGKQKAALLLEQIIAPTTLQVRAQRHLHVRLMH